MVSVTEERVVTEQSKPGKTGTSTSRPRAETDQENQEREANPRPRSESDPIEERLYSRERLEAESIERFGVERHIIVGALADERKKNFTLDEVKGLIRDFNKRPVRED